MTQQAGAPQPAPRTPPPWWASPTMITKVWIPLYHAPLIAAINWPQAPLWLRGAATAILGFNFLTVRGTSKVLMRK